MPPLVALLRDVVATADPRKSLFVVISGSGEQRKGMACSVANKSGKFFLVTCADVANPVDTARRDGNELYANRFCTQHPRHKKRHRIHIQDILNDNKFSFIPLTETPDATFPLCESLGVNVRKTFYSLVVMPTNNKDTKRVDWSYDHDTSSYVNTGDEDLDKSAILGAPLLWTDEKNTTFVVGVVGSDDHATIPMFFDKSSLKVPDLPGAVTLEELPDEVSGGNVILKWNRVEDAPNYRVFQKFDKQDAEWKRITTTTDNTSTFRVKRGECYLFRVTGVNDHGEGKESNVRRVKVLDVPMPVQLIELPSCEISDNKLTLRWSEPGDNGAPITHYTVYQRILNDDGSAPAHWTRLMPEVKEQLEYEVTGMESGKTHEFQVTATNKCGEGSKVTEIAKTVKVSVDEHPEDLFFSFIYQILSWVKSFFE